MKGNVGEVGGGPQVRLGNGGWGWGGCPTNLREQHLKWKI